MPVLSVQFILSVFIIYIRFRVRVRVRTLVSMNVGGFSPPQYIPVKEEIRMCYVYNKVTY